MHVKGLFVAGILLTAALSWTLLRLGDVERERYAMFVGLCQQSFIGVWDTRCLETVEPRTSRIWDIWYGALP